MLSEMNESETEKLNVSHDFTVDVEPAYESIDVAKAF